MKTFNTETKYQSSEDYLFVKTNADKLNITTGEYITSAAHFMSKDYPKIAEQRNEFIKAIQEENETLKEFIREKIPGVVDVKGIVL